MTAFARAKEAITAIEEAERLLSQAKDALRSVAAQSDEPDVAGRILAEILKQGGSVSKQELYRLAAQHGMDRRGLGGFFRQSGKTSLYALPGDRVLITPYGVEQARRQVESERPLEYGEPEVNLARVAEPSFAEDWDSEEDSIYDTA